MKTNIIIKLLACAAISSSTASAGGLEDFLKGLVNGNQNAQRGKSVKPGYSNNNYTVRSYPPGSGGGVVWQGRGINAQPPLKDPLNPSYYLERRYRGQQAADAYKAARNRYADELERQLRFQNDPRRTYMSSTNRPMPSTKTARKPANAGIPNLTGRWSWDGSSNFGTLTHSGNSFSVVYPHGEVDNGTITGNTVHLVCHTGAIFKGTIVNGGSQIDYIPNGGTALNRHTQTRVQ